MSVSTIPAFRAALLARLEADVLLAGVQVVIGHPFPAAPAAELVIIGDSSSGATNLAGMFGGGQSSAAIGQRSREERYITALVCSVITRNLNDQQVIEERAMAIAGVIEASVRGWAGGATPWAGITLPLGARFGWVLVNAVQLSQHFGDVQREARATIELAVSARI